MREGHEGIIPIEQQVDIGDRVGERTKEPACGDAGCLCDARERESVVDFSLDLFLDEIAVGIANFGLLNGGT